MSKDTKAVSTEVLPGLGDFTEDQLVKQTGESKGSATGDEVRELMGNITPRLERVEVKHQGAEMYAFPDGEKVQGATGFIAIVVGAARHNTFFAKPFEEREEGDRPPCFSRDGVNVSSFASDPQHPGGCAACPRNRDAREKAARDEAFDRPRNEACTNYLALAVQRPGMETPLEIRFPSSAFKPWAEYVQRIAGRGRFLPHQAVTRLKLRTEKKGGGEVSVPVFEFLGGAPEVLREQLDKANRFYTDMLKGAKYDASGKGEADAAGEAAEAARKAKAAAKAAAGQDAGL
jgi:hypothetical protein